MRVFKLVAHSHRFAGTFDEADTFETVIAISKDKNRIKKVRKDLFGEDQFGYDDDTPYITACRENAHGTFTYEGREIPRVHIDHYYGRGSLTHTGIVEFEYISESEFF